MTTPADALLARLTARTVPAAGGCLMWTGCTDRDGYGILKVDGRHQRAHRLAYTLLVGPIPAGHVVHHACRNRSCVRAEHLEAVGRKVNTRAGIGPTAINARKVRCVHGHPFTDANTVVSIDRDGRTHRRCRTCAATRKRAPAAAAAA